MTRAGAVGVISHLPNPGFGEVRRLARAAEAAGADWLGLPDAFWWRDTWLLLAEAARSTEHLPIGPLVTNPYTRHPFQTLAAIATLQDLAGPRVYVGIGAGGSEVSGAAGISRADAPERIANLISLLRRVANGEPLDPHSGRRLEVPLRPASVLVAGRGDRMLQTAGRCADQALLWAIPISDLDRSASLVRAAGSAELVWAPLVDYGGVTRRRVRTIAAYSVLNSHPMLHARWGMSASDLARLRKVLVGGGAAAGEQLVPAETLDDLVLADPTPMRVAQFARRIGATSLAIPAFSIEEVELRVGWARDVLASVQT